MTAYSYAYNCDLVNVDELQKFQTKNKGTYILSSLGYKCISNNNYFYIYKLIPRSGSNNIIKYDFTIKYSHGDGSEIVYVHRQKY